MELKDIVVSLFYFLILIIISKVVINKYYKDDPASKYILPALFLRIFGSWITSFVLIVGDAGTFFHRGRFIYNLFYQDFALGISLLLPELGSFHYEVDYYLRILRSHDTSTYFVSRTSALASLMTFNSNYANHILFSAFSFFGAWKFFNVMREMYPEMEKKFAFFILFLPSLLLWASTVSKDTLTVAGVFIVVTYVLRFFVLNQKKPTYLFWMFFGAYLLIVVKAYVLYSLIPAALLYILLVYKNKINNRGVRKIITPVALIMALGGSLLVMSQLGGAMGQYSLERIEGSAHAYQTWHTMIGDFQETGGGSSYTIGNPGDFSAGNLVQVFPAAVNVTLFRPYLWEVRSANMLFAGLESLFFLLYTLWVLKKVGIKKSVNMILSKPFIIFCIVFAIIFAFGVGFTSFNFGALARYKTPCLAFYLIGISLIYYYSKKDKKEAELASTE